MSDSESNSSVLTNFRKIFWPIEWHENKKFIPMAMMMFCILFNYAALRSIKDGFVVTDIGPEAISFLKLYVVLPSAIIMMIAYVKLCNVLSSQNVFYAVTLFFLSFIALFAFVLYPNIEYFHASKETVEALTVQYPYFQWFIRIGGNWSSAMFYVMSELWGSMMLSLLFWQFANKITKTSEAKRFYSMFGLLGNVALVLLGVYGADLLSGRMIAMPEELRFVPVLSVILASGVLVMVLYAWVNKFVLTDPLLYNPDEIGTKKKKKAKLTLGESFKMIFSSKYLGLLAIIVMAYGISINLVEGVWKHNLRMMYPTKEEYTAFMFNFQGYQGWAAIFFMLIGSNILRRVSWFTAAMLTPIMILITGLAFFSFVMFGSTIGLTIAAFLGTGPLMLVVMIGTAQNVLSKATKYSLFDSTKEMAYIPLDDEMKSKGKAAVDVIGGRFGKSGGGFIQSTFFLLFPAYGFAEATPYFAGAFFVIVILWTFAVLGLSKEYNQKIEEAERG